MITVGKLYMVKTNTTLRLMKPMGTVRGSGTWRCEVIWPPLQGQIPQLLVDEADLLALDLLMLARAFQDLGMILQTMGDQIAEEDDNASGK